jgi:hypothetical protein
MLLAACFSLATVLQERVSDWNKRGESDNVLKVLLGDGRHLFANQFFVQADISFHSGYYPSIFDQANRPKDTGHLTAKEGEPAEEEHEKQMNFLGPPRDWIEGFGRHFIVTEHTHLERDPPLAETLRRTGPAEDRNLHRRRLLAARPRQDQGSRAVPARRIAQQPGELRHSL